MGALVAVARQMELDDPLHRYGVDVLLCAESMVEGTDEDIVDVEQDAAVRFLAHRAQELPFRQRRSSKVHVTRNVLDQNVPAESLLYLSNPACDVLHHFFRIRQGQQVVQIASSNSGPAEMVG